MLAIKISSDFESLNVGKITEHLSTSLKAGNKIAGESGWNWHGCAFAINSEINQFPEYKQP